MSIRTPDFRVTTAALLATLLPAATVVPNSVDPVSAERILRESNNALVSVAFSRIERSAISHHTMFRAVGDLDVTVYALSPSVLDTTIETALGAVLPNFEWRNQFEDIGSVVTDYDYTAAGDVDVSAARIRIACQWSEDYSPDLSEQPMLDSVAITTQVARMLSAIGHAIFDVDTETSDIVLDEILADADVEIPVFEETLEYLADIDPTSDEVILDDPRVDPVGDPVNEPYQVRT